MYPKTATLRGAARHCATMRNFPAAVQRRCRPASVTERPSTWDMVPWSAIKSGSCTLPGSFVRRPLPDEYSHSCAHEKTAPPKRRGSHCPGEGKYGSGVFVRAVFRPGPHRRHVVVVVRRGGTDVVEQFRDLEIGGGLLFGGQFPDRLAGRLNLGLFG